MKEVQIEIKQKMSDIEIVFRQFPTLGKYILRQLDIKSLVKCRKVNEKWKNFIEKEKTVWIKTIQHYIRDHSNIT